MDFYKDINGWKVGTGYAPPGNYALRIENGKIYVHGLTQMANGVLPTIIVKNEAGDYYSSLGEFISATAEFFSAPNGYIGEISSVNGKYAGTFFGDDFTVTQRVPVLAAKWSQGLADFATTNTIITTGRWYIPSDENNPSYPDGVCIFESGISSTGKCFITSVQANRYEPGHLSYFGYTAAFKNVDNANGDFIALIGAFLRGADSLGLHDQIKDAICWGFVRSAGVLKKVIRVYKNFELVLEKDLTNGTGLDWSKLHIIEHQIGYYGVHPSIMWVLNPGAKRTDLLDYTPFEQSTTSIQDPNLSIGTYVENKGNTENIQVLNGSLEFGNYTDRNELVDSSGRSLPDRISIASIAVDTDPTDGGGLVAAYRVTDNIEAVDSVHVGGVTLRNFQSNIENQLLSLIAEGTANKGVRLNVYFMPESDIVATWTALRPHINVIERALSIDITSIDFTNSQFVFSTLVTGVDNSAGILAEIKPKLRPGMVAVLALEAASNTTITDLIVDLNTIDLF